MSVEKRLDVGPPSERLLVERGPAVGRSQFVGTGRGDGLVVAVGCEANGLKGGEECETNFH